MDNKKNRKIELNSQEIIYISGLVEAQRSKINLLNENYKRQEIIKEELRTAKNIERKLAFS